MLFNKSIQQSNFSVELRNEKNLEILRLFLKKLKLNIKEITFSPSYLKMMTKEDFELIKP